MKKILITFGDHHFAGTRERFRKEAMACGMFDEVIAFAPEHLDAEFLEKHGRFIELHPRGYGFWIWKPHLIRRKLEKMEEGDVLVYADAGCAINQAGAGRWEEYVRRMQAHPSGILAFEMPAWLDRAYTKMDVFEAMGAKQFLDRPMHMATVVMLRKCAASLEFVRQWQAWCEDYRLISDSPGTVPNHPDFKGHRNDQSIFSLLCKIHAVDSIPDETYGEGAIGAILARRLRPKLGFVMKLKRSWLKRRAAIAWRLGHP